MGGLEQSARDVVQWPLRVLARAAPDHGYKTGVFGKLLNNMDDYGCNGPDGDGGGGASSVADGIDRAFFMCKVAPPSKAPSG